uniref:PPM-type phosphatase domain-containing protein n=1 Tax=Ditylenchus dipsaci TaxID=166011 RepID=A0A915D0B8_9BILA
MSVLETEFPTTSLPIQMLITVSSIQGGRDHMEDRFHVEISRDSSDKLDHVFAAVFDGHGGHEASEYARRNFYNSIMSSALFKEDQDILNSIRQGFVTTFKSMREAAKDWPDPNMPGTTASCAFLRKGKIYIGHVGDSAVIKGSDARTSEQLTTDHKPSDPAERIKVIELGGK